MVLILVAVLCLPAVVGRNVPGSPAAAVHVDPRPQPGDCLAPLQTPDQLNSVFDVVPPVPCGTPHSAEVLAVGTLDARTWPKRPAVGDAAFTSGALSQRAISSRGASWVGASEPHCPASMSASSPG